MVMSRTAANGPTPADEALLAGMAMGDQGAAVSFVRRYQGRVYGLAFSMLGDVAMAQDVAQEAFLRAWRHAVVYDSRRASASTWLLTITRNLALDVLRLRRPAVTDPSDLFWEGLAARGPLTEERAEQSHSRQGVVAALRALPPEQARAVVLAAVYGFTAAEVGEREGVPLGTAKTRIRRGLLKLRAMAELGDGMGGPGADRSGLDRSGLDPSGFGGVVPPGSAAAAPYPEQAHPEQAHQEQEGI
jgi:RNA polymerase sigma-70 factor (ECF subfamily)